MRFPYPCYPAEFEIPDDWWTEAGMSDFTPSDASYPSSDQAAQIIPLREIEPPFRFPEHPKDFGGFDRARLVVEFQPWPFRFRLRDGFHRFYASVAAGFTSAPGIVR